MKKEGTMVVMMTRHCPFMSKKQLGEELGYGETTIYNLLRGFEEEVGTGDRYSRYAVAGHRYSFFAVLDYLKYKDYLKNPTLRKHVPEFDPSEIAELCGQRTLKCKK